MQSPAHAQMKVASIDDIGAAINACTEATSTAGVDAAKLFAGGWAAAQLAAKGKAIEGPLHFHGKAGNNALILRADKVTTCLVMARIAKLGDFAAVADGIGEALGSAPIMHKGAEYTWRHGSQIVRLDATGTPDAPSIRAGVIAVAGAGQ